MVQTSIATTQRSKKFWESFKNHKAESFENMFNRILKNIQAEDKELLTREDIVEIEQSIRDVKKGKFKTQEQMKKKYGL